MIEIKRNLENIFPYIFVHRADCNESCKMRKQMLETECKQLRRELMAADDLKKSAEQQSRNYEQEVIIFIHVFCPLINQIVGIYCNNFIFFFY